VQGEIKNKVIRKQRRSEEMVEEKNRCLYGAEQAEFKPKVPHSRSPQIMFFVLKVRRSFVGVKGSIRRFKKMMFYLIVMDDIKTREGALS
jgi:hypothetical protein